MCKEEVQRCTGEDWSNDDESLRESVQQYRVAIGRRNGYYPDREADGS